MESQFTVTYKIAHPFSGGYFVVNEPYQAKHYYDDGYIVTEVHTTVTLLPPSSKVEVRAATDWRDKDTENDYHEPEEV